VLGFSNPWYKAGWSSAQLVDITSRCRWQILTPPFMLAAKCVAYLSRGAADPISSHDLEDIIRLINARPELENEISNSPEACRQYLVRFFATMLTYRDLRPLIRGHLAPDTSSQQRLGIVIERMRRISGQ